MMSARPGGSSNGRTAAFEAVNLGSIPSPPTKCISTLARVYACYHSCMTLVPRRKFEISHVFAWTALALIVEAVVVFSPIDWVPAQARILSVLAIAAVVAIVNIVIATEAIEEVRGALRMLIILAILMAKFMVFFAFQYWFVLVIDPASFPQLSPDALSLLLASIMAFVFNPLALPATDAGRALLIINTFGALGLVLFVLQNINQFRLRS